MIKLRLLQYEQDMVSHIKDVTAQGNIDNISRTKFYNQFYKRNLEIEWSFLASMVSRNAGWNMTDLQGLWFPQILSQKIRNQIFFTYERANWTIFQDAFPQLMIYELSKKEKKPLFHLLKLFNVSLFMQREWGLFWEKNDIKRLVLALIINEQNVIQDSVIKHPIYKKQVFHSLPYLFQDWLHFSCVIFPTVEGELYGFSVHNFSNVGERIQLGKRLAWLLFHPEYHKKFRRFSEWTEHTGSRFDYERYFAEKKIRDTPFLRMVFPIVQHHRDDFTDWFQKRRLSRKWFNEIKKPRKYHITNWYKQKLNHLHAAIIFEKEVLPRIKS
ncbi:DUF2515 domain-containing protein [Bacillus sp. Marseille-P3661]|uniref:DUF2515 domain-containing protein n=1 Tax=Bacillus sp. Marseille-P3661 TaxID=1936234 RepID=UPI0021551616|nr:DUF2515 domain-containing protein [Bacillus sp. Marseille-P3661]